MRLVTFWSILGPLPECSRSEHRGRIDVDGDSRHRVDRHLIDARIELTRYRYYLGIHPSTQKGVIESVSISSEYRYRFYIDIPIGLLVCKEKASNKGGAL